MKAKSRKRLLLSSVAMLLVAVLALGTATFAWFTSADRAKATSMQVKATAPTGFQICAVQAGKSTSSAAWGDNLDLSPFIGDPLEPVSFNPTAVNAQSFNIYQTKMTSDGVVTSITGTDVNTGSGTKIKNLVAIDIWGRLIGSGTKEVKFNLDIPTRLSSGNAMRCAIYSVNGSTLSNKRVYYLGKDNMYTSNPDGYRISNALKASGSNLNIPTSSNNYVIPDSGNGTYVWSSSTTAYGVGTFSSDLSLSTSVTSTPVLLGRFLFWVDGQDLYCQNTNKTSLASGTGNITLNFKTYDVG